MLQHCLEQLRTLGVTDVGVVVGRFGGQIRAAFGDGAALGLRVSYLTQDRPAGLADCVRLAGDFLGDDDFVMYLGDNVLVGDLRPALRRFREARSDAHLLVTAVSDPRAYGVADLAPDGTVRAVVEKAPDPPGDLAIIGVYCFTAAVHGAVRRIRPSARGELEITDAIQRLIDDGRPVTAQRFHGAWRDVGSAAALLDCNRLLLSDLRGTAVTGRPGTSAGTPDRAPDGGPGAGAAVGPGTVLHGPVRVDPRARIIRSRLVGPVVVDAGSIIVDSLVGPDVAVGAGCTVIGAVVRDAVLVPGAVVDGGAPVLGAVAGPGPRITPGRPATTTAPQPAATP